MPRRIAVIVGTRPEVIKMAPVYRALQRIDRFETLLVSTGQHREMAQQAFGALQLTPDIDLQLMAHSQTLPELTARAITALAECFNQTAPDVVLVQGDTTTTLAAAMSAFYQNRQIGHIEAGMRTGNMQSPWPEEMNRRLTAPLSDWHFVAHESNRQNLISEGIKSSSCFVTGNTVVDSLYWIQQRFTGEPQLAAAILAGIQVPQHFCDIYLTTRAAPLILVTGHRRESHGSGTEHLCDAILSIIESHPSVGVLFPVHLNPKVDSIVRRRLGNHPRIALTSPLDYASFCWVMSRCYFIVSDSGGIQAEALSLNKPLLVTRETTEYPEGIATGGCQLVGTSCESIVIAASRLLADAGEYHRRSSAVNPYGDGRAADKIAKILADVVAS